MVYKLVTAKSPIFLVLAYGMFFFFLSIGESGVSIFWSIFLLLFGVISFFIKTKFIINQDNLNYQTMIFRFTVFQRNLSPTDINKVAFKRYGWATKGATLKLHKGFNIRIVQFTPNDVTTQLEKFAINNTISITKSKDYLLLERREKYS